MSELEHLTPETYTVPRGEEMVYHVKQEIPQFDRHTGEKRSVPRIQKYGLKEFEGGVYDNLLRQGYKIVILHNPKSWIAAQKEAAAAAAQKKAADEKEAFAKAVSEAVEKKLKEAGVTTPKPSAGSAQAKGTTTAKASGK